MQATTSPREAGGGAGAGGAADEVRSGGRPGGTGGELVDDPAMQPHTGSQVSTYERIGDDPATEGAVGRLVRPDEGRGPDVDKDEIARDGGPAGGGAGPEERAMHEVGRDPGGEFGVPDEVAAPVRGPDGAPEREPAPQERQPRR